MPAGMMNPTVRHKSMGDVRHQRPSGRQIPPTSSGSVSQWVEQQNSNMDPGFNGPPGMSPRGGNFGPGGPGGNPGQGMMGPWPQGGMPTSTSPSMNFGNPESFSFDSEFTSMFGNPHGPGGNPLLSHQKVPNENLTPEQLKRREDQLSNLRKIQQMLFPEQQRQAFGPGGPGPNSGMPGGPGGMMTEEMHAQMMQQQGMMGSPHGPMMSQHQMMTSQEQAMMHSPGGGGPVMSPAQQHFMMTQGMGQYAGPGPGGPGHGFGPQNIQNMPPAQREWLRLQQEYYIEKRKHQQQHMAHRMGGPGMGPDMMVPNPGGGPPPPSYYSSIAQKHGGPPGDIITSTSPTMNGPMGSPSMISQGMDPQDPMAGMYNPNPRSRRSSHSHPGAMEPGMGGMMGPMSPGPGMSPGPQHPGMRMMHPMGGPQGPHQGPHHCPPGPHHHMHPGGMPSMNDIKNAQVSVQRAGNPEPFHPDMVTSPSAATTASSKPPPSYAQSQKRKRDEMEDWCKNLQPTPSPQQINYLNQFEGQELTITKQLNTAYREPSGTGDTTHSGGQFAGNQAVNSPMHGPGSNKGPMSNSSQTSSGGPLSSPGPMSVPGPSPLSSGANTRLSHFDQTMNTSVHSSSNANSNVPNSPLTPTSKAAMSNITSASLANLAKGVENLQNQMQQNMMQGGPFHSIQMQGQQQQQSQGQQPGQPQQQQQQQQSQQNVNNIPHTSTKTSNHSPICTTAELSSGTQTTPSVNNTFVNATMSIQQLNIQSVNTPSGPNYNPSMNVQQMNMDQQQRMSMPQSPNGMHGPHMHGPTGQMPSASSMTSMSQSQSMMAQQQHQTMTAKQQKSYPNPNAGPHPSQMGPGMPGHPQQQMQGMGPSSAMGHSSMNSNQGHPAPNHPSHAHDSGHPGMTTGHGQNIAPGGPMMQQARPNSPGFNNPAAAAAAAAAVGNANVQIQAKAPNTIQYLPARPPDTQHNMVPSKRPDLDFMQRFAAPIGNMENKTPTSKMQYFPQPGQGMPPGPHERSSPFGNPGCGPMGPSSGPGVPAGMIPQRRGSLVEFPPDMRGAGPMGPMAGMGSPEHIPGSPMNNHPMSNMNNMPGNMPPEAAMMGPGGMGMSAEGMMAMEGMGSPGVMGPGMSHPNSPPYMDGHEPMMGGNMMQGGPPHMSPRGHGVHSAHGPMMGPGGHPGGHPEMMTAGPARIAAEMANYGPMSRHSNPNSMRMHSQGNPNMPPYAGMGPGSGPGGPGPAGNPRYSEQYQQFQQQLYSQGRPRQMSPMGGGMMPGPGHGQPYMNMMPNMPGP